MKVKFIFSSFLLVELLPILISKSGIYDVIESFLFVQKCLIIFRKFDYTKCF